MKDLGRIIEDIVPTLVAFRHELHAHPELKFQERETAARIWRRLQDLDGLALQENVAETGIVATLGARKRGPCVALRADMDALPLQEETELRYASRAPGRMHACGHDGHVACLVGAAMVLCEMQKDLRGPVKFLFQPAEESGGGARKMVEQGVLRDPRVDAVFALHSWPSLPVGTVGACAGPALASTDTIRIVVRGKGAHAARPHEAVDPILIASHIVTALQSIASRSTDPMEPVVVTLGQIEGGSAVNVIPQWVRLAGTIRTLDAQTRKATAQRATQIATNTAQAFGGEATVNIQKGYPVLVNDPKAVKFFARAAGAVLGAKSVRPDLPPSMGGEDLAYYAEKVPTVLWRLGIRPADKEAVPGLHHPLFDFSDDAIPVGVRVHCEIARRFGRQKL